MHPVSTMTLASYELEDLQRLEAERPELGKTEVLGDALYASGVEVTGDRHQTLAQRIFLLLTASCPAGFVVNFDTYWFGEEARLRPDVAAWRVEDRPRDGGAFRRPPVAMCEILSSDAAHDLDRKAPIYDRAEVSTLYVDPRERYGWWCRTGAEDHQQERVTWPLPGWPPIELERAEILAP